MAAQIERETSERDERVDAEREEEDFLPDDGGFARLELPGTEPSEQ
ncbi:MAG: hypothetical protein ACRDOS_01685 [Gaiellaceae bacterium]